MDALYETAVQAHVSTLISKGLDGLLDNAALPDLAILYNLLERVRLSLVVKTRYCWIFNFTVRLALWAN